MPKVYKAVEVCELVQLQPYVLRSWEKEFPGIGVQKSPESPRLYRQSDLEQVQRIKQLVFGEGLTVAGARRRLEETMPAVNATSKAETAEVLEALGADVRSRIARVRAGLREIHSLLSGGEPEESNGNNTQEGKAAGRQASAKARVVPKEFQLKPPPVKPARVKASPAAAASKTKAVKRASASTVAAPRKKVVKRKG